MLHSMPLPFPDDDTRPFWDGCAEGRFLIPECVACGTRRWPPGPMCPVCQATETRWLEAGGRGTLYSWVVAVHPTDPVLADQVPYVVGLVELEEGVRVIGNVLDVDPSDLAGGLALELVFEDSGGVRLPNFRRAGTG